MTRVLSAQDRETRRAQATRPFLFNGIHLIFTVSVLNELSHVAMSLHSTAAIRLEVPLYIMHMSLIRPATCRSLCAGRERRRPEDGALAHRHGRRHHAAVSSGIIETTWHFPLQRSEAHERLGNHLDHLTEDSEITSTIPRRILKELKDVSGHEAPYYRRTKALWGKLDPSQYTEGSRDMAISYVVNTLHTLYREDRIALEGEDLWKESVEKSMPEILRRRNERRQRYKELMGRLGKRADGEQRYEETCFRPDVWMGLTTDSHQVAEKLGH